MQADRPIFFASLALLVLAALPLAVRAQETAPAAPAASDAGSDPVPELSKAIQHGIYKGFAAPVALYAALGFVVLRNRKRAAGKKEEGQ